MHALLKGEVLRGGQRHARRRDTLNRGVGGEVREENGALHRAGAAELVGEELSLLERDADGGKHDGEARAVIEHLGLTRDLGGELRVRQTGAGEDRQLLAAHEGVQTVNRGDARLDELVGVVARGGVDGQAADVEILLGQQLRAAVDGLAHAVKDTAEHVLGHAQLQRVAEEADLRVAQIDARGVLEQLHDGAVAVDLQHLAAADGAVVELDFAQLVIGDALHLINDHQGAGDLPDGAVFLHHSSSPAFSVSWRICSASSRSIPSKAVCHASGSSYLACAMEVRTGSSRIASICAPCAMASRASSS